MHTFVKMAMYPKAWIYLAVYEPHLSVCASQMPLHGHEMYNKLYVDFGLNLQLKCIPTIFYILFYFPTNHTKLAMTRQIFKFSCRENDSYPS
jgi:hypothetical protein